LAFTFFEIFVLENCNGRKNGLTGITYD